MAETNETIFEHRINTVKAEMKNACLRSHRNPDAVTLVAVTKTVGAEVLPELIQAGLHHFAENRWQVAKDKFTVAQADTQTWHFIGTLQMNKVKYIVPRFAWIHSVDSLELGQAIHMEARKHNLVSNILIQVNIAGERQKHGVAPEAVKDLLTELCRLSGLSVRGFMTMAPYTDNAETTRSVFRGLRQLLSSLQQEFGSLMLNQLSMGMSNDFPVAIEEGATLVRIGRRLMQSSD